MSIFTFLTFLTLSFNSGEIQVDVDSNKSGQKLETSRAIEKSVNYEKGILRKRLDYQLVHSNKGKFILKFNDVLDQSLDVKIYDIIGNLIQKDKFLQEQGTQKEYDFSDLNTKIYVVKVSSLEENVVKKINI